MSVLSDKLNLIWYGDFELHQQSRCESFRLSDHASIKRVYRVDGNLYPTYRKNAPSNPFNTLECGYGYIIELEENTSVNIPHANFSPNGNSPRGLLVAEVDISTPTPTPSPTPSPTPLQGCIPPSYKTILYPTGASKVVLDDSIGTITFKDAGDFGFNVADFNEATTPVKLSVKDDGFEVIEIILSKLPVTGTQPQVYFECKSNFCNGNCYGGKVVKKASGDYEVILELLSSITTPTPTPSPTPVTPATCGKDDPKFGNFDLAQVATIAVGEHGHEVSSTGIQGPNTHIYTDTGKDLFEKYGLTTQQYSLLKFSPGVLFGEMRGTLNYQRDLDPSEDEAIKAEDIGSRMTYCYFEGDELPTQISEMASKARFMIRKLLQCVVAEDCTDNTISIEIDGECYTGELNQTGDHELFPFTNSNSSFGTILFLVVLKKV